MKRKIATLLVTLTLLTHPVFAEESITQKYGMDKESFKIALQVVQAESHNTYESKLATSNVILNQKKLYPSLTLMETLHLAKQWETVTTEVYKKKTPDRETLTAFLDALQGKSNVGNATYFYNPKLCKSDWHETQHYVITIGEQRYFERKVV